MWFYDPHTPASLLINKFKWRLLWHNYLAKSEIKMQIIVSGLANWQTDKTGNWQNWMDGWIGRISLRTETENCDFSLLINFWETIEAYFLTFNFNPKTTFPQINKWRWWWRSISCNSWETFYSYFLLLLDSGPGNLTKMLTTWTNSCLVQALQEHAECFC